MSETKNKKIDLRLSEKEKKEINDFCKQNNINRSNFIRCLVLQKVREEKEKENK